MQSFTPDLKLILQRQPATDLSGRGFNLPRSCLRNPHPNIYSKEIYGSDIRHEAIL